MPNNRTPFKVRAAQAAVVTSLVAFLIGSAASGAQANSGSSAGAAAAASAGSGDGAGTGSGAGVGNGPWCP